jgi:hypothetical protein
MEIREEIPECQEERKDKGKSRNVDKYSTLFSS